jgi:hypothetical protein
MIKQSLRYVDIEPTVGRFECRRINGCAWLSNELDKKAYWNPDRRGNIRSHHLNIWSDAGETEEFGFWSVRSSSVLSHFLWSDKQPLILGSRPSDQTKAGTYCHYPSRDHRPYAS